ncbi:hypothetical protein Q9S36_49370 [Microbacterium sp. ARD31]|uniref:hypothetical protein n=1 Tax=Microbacterium sp. ARD31 TaxID=2962576 RepID=UPI002882A925|nr:hypothetical protein [Microbacterium sp. ARD31]MDT0188228.1 hypothetical protein [Microbacterium sp. ARD31]MDV2987867.1 hypothetical protein [Methylobacteriaceae bacterium AG10]
MIFRTSPQADDDIAYAYVESAARFGVGQAERYQDGLFAAFVKGGPILGRRGGVKPGHGLRTA